MEDSINNVIFYQWASTTSTLRRMYRCHSTTKEVAPKSPYHRLYLAIHKTSSDNNNCKKVWLTVQAIFQTTEVDYQHLARGIWRHLHCQCFQTLLLLDSLTYYPTYYGIGLIQGNILTIYLDKRKGRCGYDMRCGNEIIANEKSVSAECFYYIRMYICKKGFTLPSIICTVFLFLLSLWRKWDICMIANYPYKEFMKKFYQPKKCSNTMARRIIPFRTRT